MPEDLEDRGRLQGHTGDPFQSVSPTSPIGVEVGPACVGDLQLLQRSCPLAQDKGAHDQKPMRGAAIMQPGQMARGVPDQTGARQSIEREQTAGPNLD